MNTGQFNHRDTTGGERAGEFRSRQRDRSRWWERPDAWDPERWKAMAAAWKSMWQDGADGRGHSKRRTRRPRPAPLRGGDQTGGAQMQALRDVAGPSTRTICAPYTAATNYADLPPSEEYAPSRRLTRSQDDRMVCGVLGGLARQFAFDSTWLRIVYALGTFFTAVIPGIIVYGMLALIIPSDRPTKEQGVD